jgi:PAS domain S-box-containing protein
MTEYPYAAESPELVKDALAGELETLYQGINQLVDLDTVPESQLQLLRGLISLSQFTVHQAAQEQYDSAELVSSLESLQYEVQTLQAENNIYTKQLQWLRDQEGLFRTTVGQLRLKAILKQTLEVALEMTYADTGSIFLLGEGRVILDCILMRQQTTEEERRDLIGRALEKGLAGWVAKNLSVGLITDARTDERWMNFPNQPYQVGSALCVPMMIGQKLVGIVTLTHPDTNHFTQQDCDILSATGYQAALVLENDRLSRENKHFLEQVRNYDTQFKQLLQTPLVGVFLIQNNRFSHVNRKLAALLGYSKEELLRLQSIASVIAYEDRTKISDIIRQCLSGKMNQFNQTFCISRKNGQVVKVTAQGVMTRISGRAALMGMIDAV